MPELPEVETTCRGIAPHVTGRTVVDVVVREPRLRQPVPGDLALLMRGQRVRAVGRRGKYLWLHCRDGYLVIHLGMSGSLCLAPPGRPPRKHDHVEVAFSGGRCLRLHDPRRFSTVLWSPGDPLQHPLLRDMGLEPLSEALNGEYLFERSRGRRLTVKQFIMDGRIVAGVGNIYANEALHMAGIAPFRPAGRIARLRYGRLAEAIKAVLREAIAAGGTPLRDFYSGDGAPGYFKQRLRVYQRQGEPCRQCGHPIRTRRLGQRASFYCTACQR